MGASLGKPEAAAPARAEVKTEGRDVDEMVRRVSSTVGQAIAGAAKRPR
jgi:hypothetical protein